MTQNLQAMLALAAQEAESGIDMNEAVKGGGGGRLLPAGYAFAQLVEYIEFGNQPQEFQGVAKEPAMEVALGFALTGKGYQNEDGSPYIIRPYSFALSRNEKARAFLLFKAMNWKGTAKNFAQMLSQKWLVKIEHVEKSKSDKTIVSRLDLKSFLPPHDPVTQQPYPIPDAADDLYKLFLWNTPTLAGWDSLKIEGTYEAKDGKPAQSKNRLQETILAALNFQGSALQLLMQGGGLALPSTPAVVPASPTPVAQVAVAPAVSSVPVVPVTPPSATAAVAPVVPAQIVAPQVVPVAVPQVTVPQNGSPIMGIPVAAAVAPAIVLPV